MLKVVMHHIISGKLCQGLNVTLKFKYTYERVFIQKTKNKNKRIMHPIPMSHFAAQHSHFLLKVSIKQARKMFHMLNITLFFIFRNIKIVKIHIHFFFRFDSLQMFWITNVHHCSHVHLSTTGICIWCMFFKYMITQGTFLQFFFRSSSAL